MRRRLTLLLGVALLGAAGCGGSGSGGFADRANAACKQSNALIRRLPPPSSDLAGVGQYAGELIPIAGRLVSKVSALSPPSGAQRDYAQHLGILRAELTGLAQLRAAALHGDVRTVVTVASTIRARGGGAIAKRLGLTSCATAATPHGA
jgi:hypothetical protein